MRRINYPAEFEHLWNGFNSEYGEKGSKKLAYEQFKRMEITASDVDYILDRYNQQLEVKKQQRITGEFCSPFQHVERYLRNERFEDEISVGSSGKVSTSDGHVERLKQFFAQPGNDESSVDRAAVIQISDGTRRVR